MNVMTLGNEISELITFKNQIVKNVNCDKKVKERYQLAYNSVCNADAHQIKLTFMGIYKKKNIQGQGYTEFINFILIPIYFSHE